MTHTTVRTTHLYPYHSHRSIISRHSSLPLSLFPLGLDRLLHFFLVTFVLAKTVTFFRYFFFPVTFFPSTIRFGRNDLTSQGQPLTNWAVILVNINSCRAGVNYPKFNFNCNCNYLASANYNYNYSSLGWITITITFYQLQLQFLSVGIKAAN